MRVEMTTDLQRYRERLTRVLAADHGAISHRSFAAPDESQAASQLLERMLGVPVCEFLAGEWDQRPRHARWRGPEATTACPDVTAPALWDLIPSLPPPMVRVIADGRPVDPLRYAADPLSVDWSKVSGPALVALMAEGASVGLYGLDRVWAPATALADKASTVFHCPASVNAYISPPAGGALSRHHDTHHVLIAQIAGSKTFEVSAPVRPWAEVGAPLEEAAPVGPPTLHQLDTGDVLYMPPGTPHRARAGGSSPSVHVTVGLHALRRYEWAARNVALLAHRPEWRRSMSTGGPEPAQAPLDDDIDTLTSLAGALDAVDYVKLRRWRHGPFPAGGGTGPADRLGAVALRTRSVLLRAADGARLVLPDRDLVLDTTDARSLEMLLESLSDPLDRSDHTVDGLGQTLVDTLIRHGVVARQ